MANFSHPPVTIYTTPTCPDCLMLKAWLAREEVAFEERDLSDHKIMAEAKARTGVRVAPITVGTARIRRRRIYARIGHAPVHPSFTIRRRSVYTSVSRPYFAAAGSAILKNSSVSTPVRVLVTLPTVCFTSISEGETRMNVTGCSLAITPWSFFHVASLIVMSSSADPASIKASAAPDFHCQ